MHNQRTVCGVAVWYAAPTGVPTRATGRLGVTNPLLARV
jgi:hypothetical protein